jgi:hypothetical protein
VIIAPKFGPQCIFAPGRRDASCDRGFVFFKGASVQRRDFLKSAAVAASLSAAPIVRAAVVQNKGGTFTLLRAESAKAGAEFLPLSESMCESCTLEEVQVEIDALHMAGDRPALAYLAIRAMFDLPNGESVPFVAWQHADGDVPSRTDSVRFVAGRTSLSRFEVDYRLHGDSKIVRETIDLVRPGASGVWIGSYVLLVPRSDGVANTWHALKFSGDERAPLDQTKASASDYLSIRISASA